MNEAAAIGLMRCCPLIPVRMLRETALRQALQEADQPFAVQGVVGSGNFLTARTERKRRGNRRDQRVDAAVILRLLGEARPD